VVDEVECKLYVYHKEISAKSAHKVFY